MVSLRKGNPNQLIIYSMEVNLYIGFWILKMKSTQYGLYGQVYPVSGGHRVIAITNRHFIHAGPLEGTRVFICLSIWTSNLQKCKGWARLGGFRLGLFWWCPCPLPWWVQHLSEVFTKTLRNQARNLVQWFSQLVCVTLFRVMHCNNVLLKSPILLTKVQ